MSLPDGEPRDLVVALNERFAAIAGWCFDHRRFVVGACLAVLIASVLLARLARIDNSYEAYFDPDDPLYLAYEQYREDFGSDEVSYILYDAPGFKYGPWNLEVMRKIKSLTAALENEVPFIYEVKTLVNAELLQGVPDGIKIRKLKHDFPKTQEELLLLRDQYLRKPMLVGGLVSADATHGAIIIKMDRSSTDPLDKIRLDPAKGDDLENLYPQATDAAIERILARPAYAGINFYHSGDVPLNAVYNRVIAGESQQIEMVAALLIGTLLLLIFRSWIAAVASLVVVQVGVMACVAFIGLLGWKLDMSFGSTPTLITAIGVAYAVHILSEFWGHLGTVNDRREALVRTMYLVGTPCLLTSLTTAAGFASMSFSPIKSIAHAGVYNAFGVVASFFMCLTLLMALLAMSRRELAGLVALVGVAVTIMLFAAQQIGFAVVSAVLTGGIVALMLNRRWQGKPVAASGKGGERGHAMLAGLAAFNVRHRRGILVVSGFLLLFSVAGMSRLVVDSNWLDDFSDAMPIKGITERVDRVMGGVTNLIYLFDAGEADGVKDPAFLRDIERVQNLAERNGWLVRKTYSIVDILKDLNQTFHGGDPAWHKLPETRELVAQYLLLYESSGGEDTEEYVSSDYRRANLELRIRLAMVSETAKLVRMIHDELTRHPLQASTVTMTGIGALWLKLLDYIISSQVQGFVMAFLVIAAMMISIFRSLKTGLISMVPNLVPVFLTLGVMGWCGIPLDYSKIMIASVAIGIAVDDTIHLISRYRHQFLVHGDYAVALRAALTDVGRALFITSVVLVVGFLAFTLSVMHSQAMYGILLATTITSALVADLLLTPALILTFVPFGPGGGRQDSAELTEAA